MGAKTCMLVYADKDAREALAGNPRLDRPRTEQFVRALFPEERFTPQSDGTLLDTNPDDREVYAGVFPGVSVIASREFGIDYPSRLPERFLAGQAGTVTLHAMHSVVDWFAYARWVNGNLVRSLSLSPDTGVLEDIGPRLPFEEPFWAGEHPAVEPEEAEHYPFPFHPLELGEAALAALFGYELEGAQVETLFEADNVPLMRYSRTRSRWRFWRR